MMAETGRPSKYSAVYCDLVIEEMATGKSLTAFAAEIGVARSTINEWMGVHPEFSEAVKIAKAKCAAWWEQKGRKLAEFGGAPGQATSVIFGLKNMGPEDWREQQHHEHTGKNGGAIQTQDVSKSEAELIEQAQRLGVDPIALGLIGDAQKAN